jgi:hypothetical protein
LNLSGWGGKQVVFNLTFAPKPFPKFKTLEKVKSPFHVAKQLFERLPFRVLMNTFTGKTRNYQQIKNKKP